MAKANGLKKNDPRDIQLANATLTATGIVFDGKLSFDDWQGVGEFLERAESGVQWWIGDWLNYGEGQQEWGDKYEQAIGMFNRDYSTVSTYKSVAAKVEFCRRKQNLSWSHHATVAYEPPELCDKLLAMAEPESPDKPPRLSVSALRREMMIHRTAIGGVQPSLEGCVSELDTTQPAFGTVYADPPWQYGNQGTRAATDNHYPTMDVDDICELPVAKVVLPDAHLHLWTTNAFLFDAKRVMEAWGFEYKSCFVWVKPQMGIGNYWRVSHEFMLFGVRGSAPFRDRSLMSWASFDRTKHSAKPSEIRQLIERASPGPYLEMFGRQQVNGWTVFGNQITDANGNVSEQLSA